MSLNCTKICHFSQDPYPMALDYLFGEKVAPNLPLLALAPNKGRNNWCHSRLRDFDLETFRDFFILRDQKTSGAMPPVAPPSSAPLNIYVIL